MRNKNYRSIRVPEATYEAAKRARVELIKSGGQLPSQIVSPENCPYCHEPLKVFEVGYRYYDCPACGYKQQAFEIGGTTVPTLGDVIGASLAILAFAAGLKLIDDLFKK